MPSSRPNSEQQVCLVQMTAALDLVAVKPSMRDTPGRTGLGGVGSQQLAQRKQLVLNLLP